MAFAGINYLAVLIAAAASFASGAVWYGVFAKPWMAAAGVTEAERNTDKSIYLVAAVC